MGERELKWRGRQREGQADEGVFAEGAFYTVRQCHYTEGALVKRKGRRGLNREQTAKVLAL